MGDYAEDALASELGIFLDELDDPDHDSMFDGTFDGFGSLSGHHRFRGQTLEAPADLSYVRIVHQTEKAWLLEFQGDLKSWVPKSRCSMTGLDEGHIYVPKWLILANQVLKNVWVNQRRTT